MPKNVLWVGGGDPGIQSAAPPRGCMGAPTCLRVRKDIESTNWTRSAVERNHAGRARDRALRKIRGSAARIFRDPTFKF